MKSRNISERIHTMNRDNTCNAVMKNDMWPGISLRNNFHHISVLISTHNTIKSSIEEALYDKRMV